MRRLKYHWVHDDLIRFGFERIESEHVDLYRWPKTGQVFSPAHAQRIAEGKENMDRRKEEHDVKA